MRNGKIKKSLCFTMSEDIYDFLVKEADQRGTTISARLREIIYEYRLKHKLNDNLEEK